MQWFRKWRLEISTVVFWGSLGLILFPLVATHFFEKRLAASLNTNAWNSDWSLIDSKGQPIATNLSLPKDIRATEEKAGRRHWRFEREVTLHDFRGLTQPALVMGRIGDSDEVSIGDCRVGSTGLGPKQEQVGWWWGGLRVYEIPQKCRLTKVHAKANLSIEVYKWGGPSYGVFGGPIGVGEYSTVFRLKHIIEWLRFSVIAAFGFVLLGIGIYYINIYLQVPARKYNGVFGLLALSTCLYEFSTSAIFYRLDMTGTNAMRLNTFGAVTTASLLLWFLRSRLGAIPRWLVGLSLAGGVVALLVGLPRSSLNGVYQVYETWFGFFLLTILIGYVQYIRFAFRDRRHDLWRYTIGLSVFVFACAHDIYITLNGISKPYVIPYGFFVFSVAVALALAKEYADAFLHVEEQVSGRTKDLAQALDQLRGLEKMKERFFANISHDFKTPIAIALGNIDEIKRGNQGEESEAIRATEGSLVRLQGMVGDLLDTVKAESGALDMNWELAKPAALLEKWVTPYDVLCKKRGIELQYDFSEYTGLEIPMDAKKMERVVANLLSNAVKFTRNGAVQVELRTDEGRAYIEVSDSGIGIPEGERGKVFDRYYQAGNTDLREHGGSGIGLSFAKEIIELHNGEMWITESESGGAKFVAALPLSQNVEIVARPPSAHSEEDVLRGSLDVAYPPLRPPELRKGQAYVLVVEDNPEVARIVMNALKGEFNVFFARNGKEALVELRKTNFESVVSDVMMPEMTGTEMLKEIRKDQSFRELPVIMLTSKGETADVVEHLHLGANDYVAKPFQREILQARVRAQVETFRLRDRLMSSEKLVTLGLLSSGIAHEIKNPLLAAQSNLGGIGKNLEMIGDLNSEDQSRATSAIEKLTKKRERLVRALKFGYECFGSDSKYCRKYAGLFNRFHG